MVSSNLVARLVAELEATEDEVRAALEAGMNSKSAVEAYIAEHFPAEEDEDFDWEDEDWYEDEDSPEPEPEPTYTFRLFGPAVDARVPVAEGGQPLIEALVADARSFTASDIFHLQGVGQITSDFVIMPGATVFVSKGSGNGTGQ